MLKRLGSEFKTIAIAGIVAAMMAGSAGYAAGLNADTVDKKHAVGSGASLTQAKNKLVAHDKGGRLPAKFIPKVASAAKADSATKATNATTAARVAGISYNYGGYFDGTTEYSVTTGDMYGYGEVTCPAGMAPTGGGFYDGSFGDMWSVAEGVYDPDGDGFEDTYWVLWFDARAASSASITSWAFGACAPAATASYPASVSASALASPNDVQDQALAKAANSR